MKVPSDLIQPPSREGDDHRYSLPAWSLGLGWGAATLVSILGWWFLPPALGKPPDWATWGAIGAALVGGMWGVGLLALTPWRPKRAADLPTLWLAATTGRILLIPGAAFLLYSATQPPDTPYVLGLASAGLALLAIEVPVIARAMLRQIALEEQERPPSVS